MTGNAYAAIISAVHAKLSADSKTDHGRNGRHCSGACPVCRLHVCLTHHECKRGAIP